MIVFKHTFATLAEIWFDPDPLRTIASCDSRVDVILFRHTPCPIPGARCQDTHTLEVDLRQSAEALTSSFDTQTTSDLKRAARGGLKYRYWKNPDKKVLDEFCDFNSRFSERKGLVKSNRQRLEIYSRAGLLDLSTVASNAGTTLTWQSFIVDKQRARYLHGAAAPPNHPSPSRSLVARANRLHHRNNMLRFKEAGVAVYDMGGWYDGKEDPKKLGINRFKEGFGGRVSKSFNYEIALSLKGKLYLELRRRYVDLALLRASYAARRGR